MGFLVKKKMGMEQGKHKNGERNLGGPVRSLFGCQRTLMQQQIEKRERGETWDEAYLFLVLCI